MKKSLVYANCSNFSMGAINCTNHSFTGGIEIEIWNVAWEGKHFFFLEQKKKASKQYFLIRLLLCCSAMLWGQLAYKESDDW